MEEHLSITKGLGDKSYDKRKAAAQELTALTKSYIISGEHDKIVPIFSQLEKDFLLSKNLNYRKGGLIGLAAASIGLGGDIISYLPYLVKPVLNCFEDPDSRVCYYACESLYNITKVARHSILRYLDEIFDSLSRLINNNDSDVKSGFALLEKLLREIVNEASIDQINLNALFPIIQKNIRKGKTNSVLFVISWIEVLFRKLSLTFLLTLPEILDLLLKLLNDPTKEIRVNTEELLDCFLQSLKDLKINGSEDTIQNNYNKYIQPILPIVISNISNDTSTNSNETSQPNNNNNANSRIISLKWTLEFVRILGSQIQSNFPQIFTSSIKCIEETKENEIKKLGMELNVLILEKIKSIFSAPNFALNGLKFDVYELILGVVNQITSKTLEIRMASLHWLLILLSYSQLSSIFINFTEQLIQPLLSFLTDESEDIFSISLRVIALVFKKQEKLLLRFIIQFFLLLKENKNVLEGRGMIIIRKLCTYLPSDTVYITLSDAILTLKETDFQFANLLVQILGIVLLSAPETNDLRIYLATTFSVKPNTEDEEKSFKEKFSNSSKEIFDKLFHAWSINSLSTYSLCLLSQAYSISAALITKSFIDLDMFDVHLLMQIDKLVKIIESPLFIEMRLELLIDPIHIAKRQDLLISLYGLLMVLPQTNAFKILSERLKTVSSFYVHQGIYKFLSSGGDSSDIFCQFSNIINPSLTSIPSPPIDKSSTNSSNTPSSGSGSSILNDELMSEYLKCFELIQDKHESNRQNCILKSTSIF